MESREVYRIEQSRADKRRLWLQQRSTGLGGSDAAVVLGMSPWKSRYELWAEKSGSVPLEESESTPHLDLGNNLEAVVLRLLELRTGRHVEAAEPFTLTRQPEREWLFCTPDGWEWEWAQGEDAPRGIVQAKTAFAINKHDWDQEPPDYYRVQLQHEMLASGCSWGTLAVLFIDQGVLTRVVNASVCGVWNDRDSLMQRIANEINDYCDFRFFDYEADAEFQAALIEAEQGFMNLVDTGTPPSTDGSESCRRAIQRLHPQDNGTEVVLPDEWISMADELANWKDAVKAVQKRIDERENALKALLGDATYAVLPDGSRFTWKTQKRKEYTVPASVTRVLRREKPKTKGSK
jgi:putative phage-type endonuclease